MSISPLLPLIAAGALTGLFLTVAVAGLIPSRPHLRSAVSALRPHDLARPEPTQEAAPAGLMDRLGRWGQAQATRWPLLRSPETDLELLEQSPQEHYAQKILLAAGSLVATLTVPALFGLPLWVSLLLALVLVPALWVLPDLSVRRQAAARRSDFAYAAVSYLRLVAIQRQSGRGVTTSLEEAARISDVWMFRRIHQELRLANWSGTTAWDALDRLSQRLQVPELRKIAEIISLSATGAGITTSLTARAADLRDKLLNDEHAEANDAGTAMSIPLMALALIYILTLLTPAVMSLLGSAI